MNWRGQSARLLFVAAIFTVCLAFAFPSCNTPPTPEQLNAYTQAATAINNAAVTDYKTIHEIKHGK